MGFSRQEYWSGLPFPTPGDPPQGWNLDLLHCRQILYHLSHQVSESMSSHPVLREFTLSSAVLFVQKLSMFHAFVVWGKTFNMILVCSEKRKRERELRFQVLRPLYKTSVTLPNSKWGNVGSEKLSNSRACGERSSDDCGPPWCQSPSLGRGCTSPHSGKEELLGDTGDAGALPVVDGKLSLGNSLKAKVSIPQMWCYDF